MNSIDPISRLKQERVVMVVLAVIFAISVIFALVQFYQNTQYRKQLEVQKRILIEQQKTISASKNKLAIVLDSVTDVAKSTLNTSSILNNKSTLSKIDEDLFLSDSIKTGETSLVNYSTNAKYIVGLHSYRTSNQQLNEVKNYLKSEGYFYDEMSYNYDEDRPSWMAIEPTVFYYSNESKQKALSLSQELEKITNKKFTVKRGRGLGVIPGQEKWTLFIHYIN